jgi:hypothetical protein
MAAGSPFIAGAVGPRRAFAGFKAITPSDTVNETLPFIALMCAVGGTVSLVDVLGTVVSLTLTAGIVYDLPPCVRVNLTGTAATGLVGFA